jgi:hypothetical protein
MRHSRATGEPDRGPTVEAPTARQMRCLRALTEITGTTFTTPRTRREASVMIAAMYRRRHSLRSEIRSDRQEIAIATRNGSVNLRDASPLPPPAPGAILVWQAR